MYMLYICICICTYIYIYKYKYIYKYSNIFIINDIVNYKSTKYDKL